MDRFSTGGQGNGLLNNPAWLGCQKSGTQEKDKHSEGTSEVPCTPTAIH